MISKKYFISISDKLFKNIRIHIRLFISFLIISVLPFLFLVFFYRQYSNEAISSKIEGYTQKILVQIKENMDNLCKKYEQYTMNAIYRNETQQQIDNYHTGNQVDIFDSGDKLTDIISTDTAVLDDIIGTEFYMKVDRSRNSSLNFNPNVSDYSTILEARGGKGLWRTFKSDLDYILYSRTLPSIKAGKNMGFITVAFTPSFIHSRLKEISITKGSYFIILDENGNTVYDGSKPASNPYFSGLDPKLKEIRNSPPSAINTFNKNISNIEYLISNEKMQNGWRILLLIPKDYITAEISALDNKILLLSPILIILILIISLFVSSSLYYPLKMTMNFIDAVKSGDMNVKADDTRKDEIGVLNKNFNEMLFKLSKLDRLKDEFLANTSHELKTPLNGIIGITESVIDGATGEIPQRTKDNLEIVVSGGKRLLNLVNDILDYSKLKNGELLIDKRNIDLRQMVEVILSVLNPVVNEKNILMLNKVPDDLPYVIGDENRLQQVLYNLIGNAVKFTIEGYVSVSAVKIDDMIKVTVEDTGIGIPEDKFETIFKSFEQLDTSISREYSGTGLGLSITRQLVELQGGKIWVESMPQKGSCFIFTIPCSVDVKLIHEIKVAKKNLGTALNEEIKENDSQVKILVVDDEKVNRTVLENQLSINNYTVHSASDGLEALELISRERYHLVLLDLMMPKMSGYEVCKKIREQYTLFDLPIIILTAKNQPEDIVACFEAGTNDYLSKPFDKSELLSRVKTFIALKSIWNDVDGITKNINELVNGGEIDLDKKVFVTKTGIVNELIEGFQKINELVKEHIYKIESQQDIILHQDRLSALGLLVGGMAHNLNTPIAVISGYLKILKDKTQDDEVLQMFDTMETHLKYMIAIISTVMKQVTPSKKGVETFTLQEVFDQVRILSSMKIKSENCILVEKIECIMENQIFGSVSHLVQVLMNIIDNAVYAYRNIEKPAKEIVFGIMEDETGYVFYIRDFATGIEKSVLDNIFKTMYTTKGKFGTGIGLYLSKTIIKAQFNGDITIESSVSDGTLVNVYVPKSNHLFSSKSCEVDTKSIQSEK